MSLLAILTASILGSLHCVGMCGGFVACYSGGCAAPCDSSIPRDSSRSAFSAYLPHCTYNLGRLMVYLLLGGVAGLLGSAVDNAGAFIGVQRVTAVLTGVLLISWGVRGLFSPSVAVPKNSLPGVGYIKKILGGVLSSSNYSWSIRAFLLGLLSTFLPCGWLYSFVALAAASGSLKGGMAVMAVFWLGTLPALLSVAAASRLLGSSLHAKLPLLTSVLLIVAGLFSLWGKVGLLDTLGSDSAQTVHSCH